MIFVESRKKKEKTLKAKYPNAIIIDLTSKSESEYKVFSPFYPHGNIPVPFSQNVLSCSVEGVWQGLKVFESNDVDISKFNITDMKGIKRSVRVFGKIKGHREGVNGIQILDYKTARKEIFIKTYFWLLENKLEKEVEKLVDLAKKRDIVFLDYETNTDIENFQKPISHAGLVKHYIEKMHIIYRTPIQTKLDL
ncbi:MAG: hypothetical protein IT222_12440 [Crocinitomix sp.]|nr:hypothetical protein [Crocinitomix sp.]